MSGEKPRLYISLHGPDVTCEAAFRAAEATKTLLHEVTKSIAGEEAANALKWRIVDIRFICDGCETERPRNHEGWTYSDGDDYCPDCTETHAGRGEA